MSVASLPSAPPPTHAQLAEHLANARKELKAFNDAGKFGTSALQQALLNVRNEANDLELRIGHARAEVAGERSALRTLLKPVSHLSAGAGLRIKDGELRPVKSRSFIKNWLGYDKVERERQAYQLGVLYGSTTCGGLRALQDDKASVDASIVSTQFEKKLTASLENAMKQAESHRQVEGWRLAGETGTLDTGKVLELMRQSAVGATQESPRPVDLGKMIDQYCKSIQVDHMEYRTALERLLRANRDSAQTALQEHERQLLIHARADLVKDLVPVDAQQRAADSIQHQKGLLEAMGGGRFGAVLKTNYGLKVINEIWKGLTTVLNGKKVAREIEDCLGDVFSKGAADEGKYLRYYADDINEAQLRLICKENRALMLNGYANGRATDRTYRCAAHSDAMLDALRKLARSGRLLRPQQFMCTAEREEDTLKYPMGGLNGLRKVKFEIESITALRIVSRYDFAGEHHPDYVLTPYAGFRVLSVDQKGDAFVVRLQEVPATGQQLKDARLLTL